jgi:hypothetical protein
MMEILKKIASNVAKATKYFFLVFFLCSIIIGCARPTNSDKEALQVLTGKFGERYDFKFDGEFWLIARAQKDVVIRKGEDEEMYKVFFFENKGLMKERNTSYVYLDLYDSDGKFVCQLYFDPQTKAFRRNNKPYRS